MALYARFDALRIQKLVFYVNKSYYSIYTKIDTLQDHNKSGDIKKLDKTLKVSKMVLSLMCR